MIPLDYGILISNQKEPQLIHRVDVEGFTMSENSQSEASAQDDPIYVIPWQCQGIDELRSSLQGAKEPWSQEGN